MASSGSDDQESIAKDLISICESSLQKSTQNYNDLMKQLNVNIKECHTIIDNYKNKLIEQITLKNTQQSTDLNKKTNTLNTYLNQIKSSNNSLKNELNSIINDKNKLNEYKNKIQFSPKIAIDFNSNNFEKMVKDSFKLIDIDNTSKQLKQQQQQTINNLLYCKDNVIAMQFDALKATNWINLGKGMLRISVKNNGNDNKNKKKNTQQILEFISNKDNQIYIRQYMPFTTKPVSQVQYNKLSINWTALNSVDKNNIKPDTFKLVFDTLTELQEFEQLFDDINNVSGFGGGFGTGFTSSWNTWDAWNTDNTVNTVNTVDTGNTVDTFSGFNNNNTNNNKEEKGNNDDNDTVTVLDVSTTGHENETKRFSIIAKRIYWLNNNEWLLRAVDSSIYFWQNNQTNKVRIVCNDNLNGKLRLNHYITPYITLSTNKTSKKSNWIWRAKDSSISNDFDNVIHSTICAVFNTEKGAEGFANEFKRSQTINSKTDITDTKIKDNDNNDNDNDDVYAKDLPIKFDDNSGIDFSRFALSNNDQKDAQFVFKFDDNDKNDNKEQFKSNISWKNTFDTNAVSFSNMLNNLNDNDATQNEYQSNEHVIELKEVNVPDGHQNEILLNSFGIKKLYVYDATIKEWKQRASNTKCCIYQSKGNDKRLRIVVREEKTLILRLNHYISSNCSSKLQFKSNQDGNTLIWYGNDSTFDGVKVFSCTLVNSENSTKFQEIWKL